MPYKLLKLYFFMQSKPMSTRKAEKGTGLIAFNGIEKEFADAAKEFLEKIVFALSQDLCFPLISFLIFVPIHCWEFSQKEKNSQNVVTAVMRGKNIIRNNWKLEINL